MPGQALPSAAPTTASTMQVRRLSALERPAIVQRSRLISRHRCKKPDKKKDAAYSREGLPYDSMPLWCRQHFGDAIMARTTPAPNEEKKTLPGQPLGNMENSRCREGSTTR